MDWRILAAITVICWGAYNIVLKAAADRIPWQLSMAWFVISYALTIGSFVAFHSLGNEKFRWMDANAVLPIVAGVLCGVGAITFFKAIPLAPGSLLMPIVGLFVLVSAVGCLIVFREPVTLRVIAGIFFAAVAIVLLSK